MSAKRLEVRHYGEFIATRHRGRQIRDDAEEMLRGAPTGADTLVLDFTGVKGVTATFADELVAKSHRPLRTSDRAGRHGRVRRRVGRGGALSAGGSAMSPGLHRYHPEEQR